MLTQNRSACEWRSGPATCGLFTTVHVLSWFLIVTCKFPPPSLLRLVQRAFSVRGGICYLQQGCNNPRNRHGTSPNAPAPSSGLASGQRRRGRSEARGHKDIGSSQFQQDMLFVFIIFLYQVYIPDARGREGGICRFHDTNYLTPFPTFQCKSVSTARIGNPWTGSDFC